MIHNNEEYREAKRLVCLVPLEIKEVIVKQAKINNRSLSKEVAEALNDWCKKKKNI